MKMSGGVADCSRLCRLIERCLRPYTESGMICIGKEKEKDVLLVLSQVLREIQLWTTELDANSDNEATEKSACDENGSDGSKSRDNNHCCMAKIVGDLILLLTVESQFVQHLVGNVLVVISDFMVASGSEWSSFIHSLCVCLELAISATLSYSSALSTTKAESSNWDSSSSFVHLKTRLKITNWSTMAGLIRVLRNILKHLKEEGDDQLVEVYLDSVNICLVNMPWDSMDAGHAGQDVDPQTRNTQNYSCADTLYLKNAGNQDARIVFLGNFIQFLCSLVEQSQFMVATCGSKDQHPILCTVICLIPKLLHWCLGEQGGCVNMSTSQYFKHKLMMLMIRLSSLTQLDCPILVSWLQLLHSYFQEFLWQPITQLESGKDDCLEGSPFLLGVSDGEACVLNSRHLQRQAILLFLKCSFSLISIKGPINKQCPRVVPDLCSFDSNSDMECCGRKKGVFELSNWLQRHLPTELFVDNEMYLENCIGFALSFLQLYMHEDDALFKMLLQLLCVPFCAEQRFYRENWTPLHLKEDILFHVSNLFNPVHLFHLFLAELHYDHQVLLDYLISKDTGISCAEYLLRCLRTVCDSWDFFMEFSLDGKLMNQPSCKKRKVLLDGSSALLEISPAPVKNVPPLVKKEFKRDYEYGCRQHRTREQPFKKAKDCLFSLKSSMENLHQKNLFPYNPEVLLKRLTRFQELCFYQENDDVSKSGGGSI